MHPKEPIPQGVLLTNNGVTSKVLFPSVPKKVHPNASQGTPGDNTSSVRSTVVVGPVVWGLEGLKTD